MRSLNDKPLVIFELANNHMGDVTHAKKIIDNYYILSSKYKKYGIDFAFKFQFRDLDTFIHPKFKNSEHIGVKRFESTKFANKQWVDLIKFTKKRFLTICTAFDEPSVDKIINYKFDYIKIASCSINDWPLIEYIAKHIKKKKIVASLGGKNEKEIRDIISFFSNRKKNIKYFYCVAKYPTLPKDLNLSYFLKLKSIYNDKISGFSTHEDPDEVLSGAIAYAMGARFFEKHVNINSQKYEINKYSTTPDQIEKWLSSLSDAIIRCGSAKKRTLFINIEKKNLGQFERGVYVNGNKYIQKGELLNYKNVVFAYPKLNTQLSANDFSKFSKYTAKKNLKANEPISKNHLIKQNSRTIVEIIRDKILGIISLSKIVVPNNSRLEISHHKGLDKFKKYGLAMITVHNEKYCKKYLFILHNQIHPAQYHNIKEETFFILFGSIKLILKKNGKEINRVLKTGDIITIKPGTIHKFKGLSKNGTVIEELSTKHIKNDSFYIDKNINKNENRKSLISLN
ncbi:N-acetylneuraminate synthase family protein [Pelagibacterales bacterium SAG-MED35]|nr:N-acetylneuraminate synthase family protein [Pelagibacterales bacterium SAG-MED35]